MAFLYKISGASLIAITKWLVIISGAALSLTVYSLSLEIFNNKTAALVSAFLIAVSEVQLLAYMNYYPQILAMALMPLAFVFLVRSIKYEKFEYLFLTAILSSLVVLASYIAAFVYFLIFFLSIGIWIIWDKKSLKILILVPVMTGALLAFFWLPMVWRQGIMNFSMTAQYAILHTSSTFTNTPWTLISFITYSNSTIVAIIMGICAIFLIKKPKWDFQKLLLVVWLIVTFILIGSYLFRPILWVDRYFQFFDIALLISAGVFFTLVIDKLNSSKKNEFKYTGYFLLFLLLAYSFY